VQFKRSVQLHKEPTINFPIYLPYNIISRDELQRFPYHANTTIFLILEKYDNGYNKIKIALTISYLYPYCMVWP
jgi:hypothetical protein